MPRAPRMHAGSPAPTIELERLDEHTLGELLYFFMFSCYLSARLLEVNPFNQPGVEAYKRSCSGRSAGPRGRRAQ